MKRILFLLVTLFVWLPVSASTATVEITSGGASFIYIDVSGIPQTILGNMQSGDYVKGSNTARFLLTEKNGTKYGLNGNLDESGNTTASTKGMVWIYNPNPNAAVREIPSGEYTLTVIIEKLTSGTPSYVLNSTQVFEVKSKYFNWPLTKSTSDSAGTPTCTLTATPSSASLGDKVVVAWTSTNAKKLKWVRDTSGKDNIKPPKGKVKKSGSKSVVMDVEGNPFLTLQVTGKGKQKATCSVVILVSPK